MNTAKLDAAVLLMQGLNEAERAVVMYTVEREAGRLGRKRNSRIINKDLQQTLGLCQACMDDKHPNKVHVCTCACAA